MPTETPHRGETVPLRAFVLAALAAALVSLAGCSPKSDSADAGSTTARNVTLTADQRRHIQLYTVSSAPFRKSIDATGAVDFDNDQATSVLAPFSGPVSRLLVELGQTVKAGEPLATVDSPDFAAAAAAYSKALASAKTDRQVADADKDLVQHNGISQREAQQAQTDAANAEADRDAALKGLTSLNIDPQSLKDIEQGRQVAKIAGVIRSPISGTVVEKLITPGQLLQAGMTPCFTVANLSRVWVMAQVFGSDQASVSVGDPVEIVSDNGSRPLTGVVDNISALVNPDTRSVIARVAVDNPRGVLKKQMYVSVKIKSRQQSTGLLVPVSAILRDDENLPFVYAVQPDGSFARRSVTLGDRTGDRYLIPAGLRGGEQVVVDGALFVQFMQNQ